MESSDRVWILGFSSLFYFQKIVKNASFNKKKIIFGQNKKLRVMKFYDIDSVFISGKYAGETLAEVFEKDPKYINYCQENDDDFYVSPEVMKELRTLARDHRLLTQDLDKMSDDELAEFMEEMNDIDVFDENNFDDDFDWDAEDDIFAEFEDEYDIEDDDYNFDDFEDQVF